MTAATAKPVRYLTCAETAKLLRTALKAAFPAVKFSVRSHSYAGGASIYVRWADGPTKQRVEAIADHFAGADFDGMQDLKTYHETVHEDERVHMGADYVFCHRDVSDAEWTRVAPMVARKWGVRPVPARVEAHGLHDANWGHRSFGELVNRACEDRTEVAGWEVEGRGHLAGGEG